MKTKRELMSALKSNMEKVVKERDTLTKGWKWKGLF